MLCYLVISVISIKNLCSVTKVRLNIGKIFVKPAYAGILCAIGAVILYIFLGQRLENHLSLLAAIAFGGLIYLISLVLLGGITKDEIKSVFKKENL